MCKGTGPECVCKTITFNNSTFTFSGDACQCSEFYCFDTSTGMVRGENEERERGWKERVKCCLYTHSPSLSLYRNAMDVEIVDHAIA